MVRGWHKRKSSYIIFVPSDAHLYVSNLVQLPSRMGSCWGEGGASTQLPACPVFLDASLPSSL